LALIDLSDNDVVGGHEVKSRISVVAGVVVIRNSARPAVPAR